jgi:hypothetical protein
MHKIEIIANIVAGCHCFMTGMTFAFLTIRTISAYSIFARSQGGQTMKLFAHPLPG